MSQQELKEIEQQYSLISSRLIAGKHVVHIMADDAPEGFEAAPANLEDVYFSTLYESRKKSAQAA